MGTTLLDLRGQCRKLLASTSDWPDATLDAFIADAIRFYSAEYPRLWRYTLTLATGTQAYALPGGHGFQGIVSVEYPAGETPPRFVERAAEWEGAFQARGDAYAVRGVADTTTAAGDTAQGQIVFAAAVATGESAVISYRGGHAAPTADNHQVTLPVAHWEALIAFVDFRCHWELETDEACSATTVSLMMGQLGENGRRAWNRYRETMDRIRWLTGSPSAWVSWAGMGL